MENLIGKVVTFRPAIEDMEAYPEGGMKARIRKVCQEDTESDDLYEHVYQIVFDYSEFDQTNRNFESSNYYDSQGAAVLNAREAGLYSEIETIYFGAPEIRPFEDYFEVEETIQVNTKSYKQAIRHVAKEYTHEVHDKMSPAFPYAKAEMIAFIFGVDVEKVVKQIKTVEVDCRNEWWK